VGLQFCHCRTQHPFINQDPMAASSSDTRSTYHPPIIEAVIDFDCELPPGTSLTQLSETIREATADKYPEFKEVRLQELTLTQNREGTEHRVANNIAAYQCVSADKTQLIQFRNAGFSFNRLEPYNRLDDYLPEIGRTWDIYRKIVQPAVLKRISMRYINRILLPNSPENPAMLREYFTVTPAHIPSGNLQLVGIFQSLRFQCSQSGAQAQLTLATENPTPDAVPVIVDIEAFITTSEEPAPLEKILGKIDLLRGLKNEIYNSTLTEQCQNLFQ